MNKITEQERIAIFERACDENDMPLFETMQGDEIIKLKKRIAELEREVSNWKGSLECSFDDVLVAFTQSVYETGELSSADANWLGVYATEWKPEDL